jgi:hypothetical protein
MKEGRKEDERRKEAGGRGVLEMKEGDGKTEDNGRKEGEERKEGRMKDGR